MGKNLSDKLMMGEYAIASINPVTAIKKLYNKSHFA